MTDTGPRPWNATQALAVPWREPLELLPLLHGLDGALALFSGDAGLSRIALEPDATCERRGDPQDDLQALFALCDDPAWQRGTVALAAYDAGAREATGPRPQTWPDLMAARYAAWLVFDPDSRVLRAIGHGETQGQALAAADRARAWLDSMPPPSPVPGPPTEDFTPETGPETYGAAVADVIRRIGEGELFQANVSRGWHGRLKTQAEPLDVFRRLAADSPAPYAAFWRMGDRALVSNSPELFLSLSPDGQVSARPIKGTRPRRPDSTQDRAEAEALARSPKDRAENLMIVDLMRNDLSRVCEPASVRVQALFALESFVNVHHLVSTVTGRLAKGRTAGALMAAAFPPGSITGAPKHQAMKVIARHEPPRGPWCGSLVARDETGTLQASVLIRTLAFEKQADGWHWRTRAGAGIVADSDPEAETLEVEHKIAAIRRALTGQD